MIMIIMDFLLKINIELSINIKMNRVVEFDLPTMLNNLQPWAQANTDSIT